MDPPSNLSHPLKFNYGSVAEDEGKVTRKVPQYSNKLYIVINIIEISFNSIARTIVWHSRDKSAWNSSSGKAKRNEFGYSVNIIYSTDLQIPTDVPTSSSFSNYSFRTMLERRLQVRWICCEREREMKIITGLKIIDRFPRSAASPYFDDPTFSCNRRQKMSFFRNKNNLFHSENYQSIARKWVIFQPDRWIK
jgi:hypothetical protein